MTGSIISRFNGLKKTNNNGQYIAICPSHKDNSPSLAIKFLPDGRTLLHCFAGCNTEDVMLSIGLSIDDLLPDRPISHNKKGLSKQFSPIDVLKIMRNESKIAYLCACDLAKNQTLSDSAKDRLLIAVSRLNHACEVVNEY